MLQEIKPQMIEALKPKQSLKAAELQDGDIICFQKVQERKNLLEKKLSFGDNKQTEESVKRSDRSEDARDYYDFLFHKRTINFHPHPSKGDRTKYSPFDLVISCKVTYDLFAEKVGDKIGVEPTHLRFYSVNSTTGNPKTPVKRGGSQQLSAILNPATNYSQLGMNQRSDAFYFEVLDMSLAELDTKKNIKVTWLSEGITKEVSSYHVTLRIVRLLYLPPAGPLRRAR